MHSNIDTASEAILRMHKFVSKLADALRLHEA